MKAAGSTVRSAAAGRSRGAAGRRSREAVPLRVVGLGAGGHAKVVVEILRALATVRVAGLLDPNPDLWGTEVAGVPVLGDDSLLPSLYQDGVRGGFVGVGSRGDIRPRRQLYERLRAHRLRAVQAIHPQAIVAPSARLSDGVTVMAAAVINAAACLGSNVVVNTGAIVEHDCVVAPHAFIATGARLAGGVHLEEGVHVGVGASVREGIRIGRGAVVGAGAAVVADVPEHVVVVGVPARVLRPAAEDHGP